MSTTNYRRKQSARVNIMRQFVDTIKMILVMGLIAVAVIIGIRIFNQEPLTDTFCEGLYINGVPMAGMTYDEGVTKLKNLIHQRLYETTYTLSYGNQQWKFVPRDFDATLDLSEEIALAWNFGHTGTDRERRQQKKYLKENPINYEHEIAYDENKLSKYLVDIKSQIDTKPVSATVTVLDNEKLEISRSSYGRTMSLTGVKSQLDECMLSGSTANIELNVEEIRPKYTTEELQENTQLIASWRTKLVASSSNRTKNVARALQPFNGLCVSPGEVVSFNTLVGKRTKANGFFEAAEYDGATVVQGVGGGTCQASSTLYGAVLLANLDVVVRGNHSMCVDYALPSLDAAVYETKDFKFVNNLEYPVYFYTRVTENYVYATVYGPPCQYRIELDYRILNVVKPSGRKFVKDTEGKHIYYEDSTPVIKTEGKDGLKSQAYRVYYDRVSGAEVSRQEMNVDNYSPLQPTYWVGVHRH